MNINYHLVKHEVDQHQFIHGMRQTPPSLLMHQKANSCLQFEGEGRKMVPDSPQQPALNTIRQNGTSRLFNYDANAAQNNRQTHEVQNVQILDSERSDQQN